MIGVLWLLHMWISVSTQWDKQYKKNQISAVNNTGEKLLH